MRTLALLALGLVAVFAAPASAAPCRDGKGKFIACAPAAPAAARKCRDGAGRFMKCGGTAAAVAPR